MKLYAYLGWGGRIFILVFWIASGSVFLIGHQLIFAPEQPHPGRKTTNDLLMRLVMGKGASTEGQTSLLLHEEQVGEGRNAGKWDSLQSSHVQSWYYLGPRAPRSFCSHTALAFCILPIRLRQTL